MIKLLKDLYLDNDSMQFILKKKSTIKDENSKRFGEESFTNLGYYPKIEQLLQDAVMKKLKEHDYYSLQMIADKQDSLINELNINIKKLNELLNTQK